MTESTEPKPKKAAPSPATAAKAENSVSPAPTVPAPIAKPAPRHVYGKGAKDDVLFSRVRDSEKSRKSLTIKHLQRRLGELGYDEGTADKDANYGALTASSVTKWQVDNGHDVGALTPGQFSAIFEGDNNVNVVLD